MGRRLAAAVHVRHPKTNEQLILQPGDEPDDDLAGAITHPDAWEPEEDDDASEGEEDAGDGGTEPDPAPTPDLEPEAKPTRSRTRKQADEQ
ncbi:hypothetical protein ABZ725_50635 [Streptomyces sp. NPDC006872]|uniref:hypothetical protein n=1 Tax=Streptomyces sp. NPDC006872 TaxID=3155720 RepID=UPI0033F3584F